MTSISIRAARAEDADAILHCLAIAFEPVREQYTAAGYADTVLTAETVRERLASMALFVAESDGRIVGTIGGRVKSPGHGHVRGMAVLPEAQGSGAAGLLLRAVEDELRDRNCSRVTLNTTAPLQRAIRFYEKNGYRRTGRVSDFFGMELYEYEKTLSPGGGRQF